MFPGPHYGFLIRVILSGWSDGRPQRPDLTGRGCALFEESGLRGAPRLSAKVDIGDLGVVSESSINTRTRPLISIAANRQPPASAPN